MPDPRRDPAEPSRAQPAAAHAMPVGWLMQDLAGRLIDCNAAAERLLGQPRAALLGRKMTWPGAVDEDGRPLAAAADPLRQLLAGSPPEPLAGALVGLPGDASVRVWVQIDRAVCGPESAPVAAITTLTDVSALKARAAAGRDQDGHLRLALDSGNHGVWDWNPVSGELQFTAAFYDRLGATGMSLAEWEALIHPDDRAHVRDAVASGLRPDSDGYRAAFRLVTRGGEVRHIIARGKVVERDANGRARRMIGTHTDETEQHDMRLRLAESEQRFRLFANATPLPMWMSGPPGQRVLFNDAWLRATGRPLEDELGQGWTAGVHPDDRALVASTCGAALHAPAPVSQEYRLRQADGRYRRYLDHAVPRLDDNGRLLGYMGLCVDIEGRHQAENTVRQLSRAIEQMNLSVVITDPNGCIEFANTACCERYGYTRDELIGANTRIFASGETSPAIYRDLWSTIHAGRTWTGEITNKSRSGRLILEAIGISPVRDEHGEISHFVALKENITERRAAEERARDLDQQLTRLDRLHSLNTLVSGIAHDFNNILVSILGFSELAQHLLQHGREPERALRYLEEIQTAGERARSLVGKLLAYGRSDHAAVLDVALGKLIREAGNLVAASLPIGMSIELDCDPEDLMLEGDGGQLLQLLTNLMLNARDAMDDRGVIRVRVRTASVRKALHCESCHAGFAGEYLRIDVEDSGAGIMPDSRQRIFEPFYTTKDVGRGTGMGLAVVHGVAHRHGGHLTLATAPSQGSCFSVFLARNPG